MKKILGLLPLAVLLAATLTSCNLAGLFGGSGNSGAPQLLTGFTVAAKQNPGLAADETAVVDGTNIYLTLPYLYAVQGEAVTPTPKLASGATIKPEGTYVIKDGMALSVTAAGTTYSYTVHLGVDPSTIALPPLLTAYAVKAADNSNIPNDENAVIYGKSVYLTLPYSIITESLPLTVTASTASGYSLSPTGTYAPTDGMTLEVTNNNTQQLYDYTLHVAADPSTSPPLPPLQTYQFLASNNSALSSDANAVIDGTDIFVTLPYTALQTQTAMTPTVKLLSGYTISPSGSYIPQDGMTLVVLNTKTEQVTDYTVHVAVATSTIP